MNVQVFIFKNMNLYQLEDASLIRLFTWPTYDDSSRSLSYWLLLILSHVSGFKPVFNLHLSVFNQVYLPCLLSFLLTSASTSDFSFPTRHLLSNSISFPQAWQALIISSWRATFLGFYPPKSCCNSGHLLDSSLVSFIFSSSSFRVSSFLHLLPLFPRLICQRFQMQLYFRRRCGSRNSLSVVTFMQLTSLLIDTVVAEFVCMKIKIHFNSQVNAWKKRQWHVVHVDT